MLDGGWPRVLESWMLGLEGLGFLDVRVRGFRLRRRGGNRMHHIIVFNYSLFSVTGSST